MDLFDRQGGSREKRGKGSDANLWSRIVGRAPSFRASTFIPTSCLVLAMLMESWCLDEFDGLYH